MDTDVTELIFDSLPLSSGDTLVPAQLSYATHGRLNATHTNVILYPTAFGGQHADNTPLIGPGRPLDTDRYFIIVPDQLGNGLSSSPSNHPTRSGADFPRVSIADNVRAQARLLDHLKIDRLALAVGFSMGGQQAYQWAVEHPDRVVRLACICSAARSSAWQRTFLGGIRSILNLGATHGATACRAAAGRAWAAWGLSDRFYDQEMYRKLGYATASDFIEGYWVERMARFDLYDLLTMLQAWYDHDVTTAATPGDLGASLGRVRCDTTLITSSTDAYFLSRYAAEEARLLPNARHVILDSPWGHVAGRGMDERDAGSIETALRDLLARPPRDD